MLGPLCPLWPHPHPPHYQGDLLRSWRIHYIFCEMDVLLRLACSNIHITHTVLIVTGCVIFFTPLGFMTTSYVWIVRAILQIPSASGKQSFFHPCLPLGCGLPLLWDTWYGISAAPQNPLQEGLSSPTDVCCGDPHDEPFHL